MGKIMAIGGMDVTDEKSLQLNELLVSLSGVKRPHFLFISAASGDDPDYIKAIVGEFKKLGCTTDELTIVRFEHFISKEYIKDKILNTDIILIGDGDLTKLLKIIHHFALDKMLAEQIAGDKVLAGIGAGAKVLFTEAVTGKYHSPEDDSVKFNLEKGMGFIQGIAYSDDNPTDSKLFTDWFKGKVSLKNVPAFVFSGNSALLIEDGSLHTAPPGAKHTVKLLGVKNNKLVEKILTDKDKVDAKNPFSAI